MLDNIRRVSTDSAMALIERCKMDTNPDKIDLGVGVFQNANGEVPVLKSVKIAESFLVKSEVSKSYVSPIGNSNFRHHLLNLILGPDLVTAYTDRFATCQTAGGSGALRIGADLITRANPDATIWVSTPTWVNHFPLLGATGLIVKPYPYFDVNSMTLKFDDLITFLDKQAKPGDVVLLHGCCHNPSGADLSTDQWDSLAVFLQKNKLTPFIDIAYLGFGKGFAADTYGVRTLTEKLPEVMIAASCSKNFAIYRERVGFFVTSMRTKREAAVIQATLGAVQRCLISMPPNHGAEVVGHILGSEELRARWLSEVKTMRESVTQLRNLLAASLRTHSGGNSISSIILQQTGLFSLLPITKAQVAILWDQSIYLTPEGRINISGVNAENVERLSKAIMTI